MTVKLNLTMDEDVVKRTKKYAAQKNTSVSKLVEEYLDKITIENNNSKKGLLSKWSGILNGKLSEKEVEKILNERRKEYGY
jgi:hypothetical protein